MKALWLAGGEVRFVPDLPEPGIEPDEALVRVLAAGICNTDLELVRGYYPYDGVPGHEFVGVADSLGAGVGADERERLLGRRVVGEINAACGSCRECRSGRPTHCLRRTVLGISARHGAFAEYLALPVRNLHAVPDAVSTDAAVFAEPLAAALEILEQVDVAPSDRVAVIGAGKLGILISQVLALTGCELSLVARSRSAGVDLLTSRGIHVCSTDEVKGRSIDLAVECTGNPEGYRIARAALRPRGTLILKSTYAGRLDVDPSAIVVDEITVIGSRCGPFRPALRLLERGQVSVEPLVEARFPLDQGPAAFERAARPGALKVLLEVGGP
jgi:threonine dehydrogenase-like Zn-dependent dehydrogenase